MDDRQLRKFYLLFFSCAIFIIFSFVYTLTGDSRVLYVGLILVPLLGFGFPHLQNFISKVFTSLILGFDSSNLSYEEQSYQSDMDKAKRLVRDGEWERAISMYRKIVEKAPRRFEARFGLAQAYQVAGYTGLALLEYHKIRDLKEDFGQDHPFVLESERMIEELNNKNSLEKKSHP